MRATDKVIQQQQKKKTNKQTNKQTKKQITAKTKTKNKTKQKKNKTKTNKIGYTITKWWTKNQFPSHDIKFLTKNRKTTFPKEFFLEIWLIIENCKYNYTAVIKLKKKKLFGCAFMGKTNFEERQKMLIYA